MLRTINPNVPLKKRGFSVHAEVSDEFDKYLMGDEYGQAFSVAAVLYMVTPIEVIRQVKSALYGSDTSEPKPVSEVKAEAREAIRKQHISQAIMAYVESLPKKEQARVLAELQGKKLNVK